MKSGPLHEVSVLELSGIGPGPFAAMLLADMGADVVQVVRPNPGDSWIPGFMGRGRRSIGLDLKSTEGRALCLRLVERADILVEGFRPGVAERLGLGPAACLERNPALVYGRMTGWGQDGPLAQTAGHDIDYLALAGALWPLGGSDDVPLPPLNLVADFGGGAMFLVAGLLAALHEAGRSGRGQVVDAAMIDGVASLTTMFHEMRARGLWIDDRAENLLDGAAPFYSTYRTGDGRFVAVGALEPQFYRQLLEGLGLVDAELPDQMDREGWEILRERFAAIFHSETREHWEQVFSGTDACVSPVLEWSEVPDHPHNRARQLFTSQDGARLPGPAPRFSNHPGRDLAATTQPGGHSSEVLSEIGLTGQEIEELRSRGVVG